MKQVFLFFCWIVACFAADDVVQEDPPPPLKDQLKPWDLPAITARNKSRSAGKTCHPGEVDLYFVVDESGSIGSSNFATVRQFLENVVTQLHVESTGSRVGVVEFMTGAHMVFGMNAYTTTSSINTAIGRIPYGAGGTYIASGMNLAVNTGFTAAHGDRAGIPNVMVVLTDGHDGNIPDVTRAFNAAKAKHILVIAIGVGSGVNVAELRAIAGNNLHNVFDVAHFTDLSSITGVICEEISDPCDPNPCKNRGACQKVDSGFQCTCPAGYTGTTCETNIDECQSDPCRNNGTCHDLVNEFACTCPKGATGATCETNNACSYTPCGHGTCHPQGATSYSCTCDAGYYGDNCENAVCQHGGNFSCTCSFGYTGPTCADNIDNCQPNPCLNDGTCIDNPDGPGYTCQCDKLYEGENCSESVDFCPDLQILQNGTLVQVPVCEHGSCVNVPGSGAFCVCESDEYSEYSGQFCEIEHPKSCTWKGETYPHNSTWVDKCDSCACIYGQVECADSHWCPQRCALYSTPKVVAQNISTTCPPNQNCIPEEVRCAKPVCDFPIGWCFPVGMVMVDNIVFPTNPPAGYKVG